MSVLNKITSVFRAQPGRTIDQIRSRIKAGEQKSKPREDTPWERFLFNSGGKIKDYKRMIRDDAQIKSAIDMITNFQLSKDFVVTPASENPDDIAIADFIDEMIRGMKIPLRRVRKDMLTALPYGKSVSEIVYEYDNINYDEGRLVWKYIRSIHIDTLHEDDWIEYDKQGDPITIIQTDGDGNKIPIPAEKLLIYAFDMEFGNLNGNSILQSVYDHWFMKKKIKEWYHVYLQKLQSPFLHGKVNSPHDRDDLQIALDDVREGRTNLVTGTDDEIMVIESKQKGSGFLDAIRYHDMMIFRRMGIGSLIFGMDLTSGSYAQSKTQQAILNTFMEGIQEDIAGVLQQKLMELVDLNFTVNKYPHLTFEPFTDEDILGLLTALQPYAKYMQIDTSSEWFSNLIKTAVERNSDIVTRDVHPPEYEVEEDNAEPPGVAVKAPQADKTASARLSGLRQFLAKQGYYHGTEDD